VGGRDESTALAEVEFFDPHTNRWTSCASMHKRRGSVAVAECQGFIYAIGGHDFSRANKSVVRYNDGERYDPRCNQWTMLTGCGRGKEGLAIASVEKRLYIVGGFDGKILDEMELYNSDVDRWEKVNDDREHLTRL
jgi:kelch-like protein 1/4/5